MKLVASLLLILGFSSAVHALDVKSIDVRGISLPIEPKIDQSIEDYLGEPITVDLLEQLKASIFQTYSDAGYFARVTFPEQDLTNGVIRINVQELTLGHVTVSTDDSVRFDPARAEKYFTRIIKKDAPLSIDDLDRQSTALNGLNGVAAEQSVSFPEDTTQVDVEIKLKKTELAEFSAQVDNFGTEETGRERISIDAQYNSLLAWGDRIVLSGVKSRGLSSRSVDFELPVGYRGERLVYGRSDSNFNTTGATSVHGKSMRDWARFRSGETFILSSPFNLEVGVERSRTTDSLNENKETTEQYVAGSLAWVNSSSSAAANVSARLILGDLHLYRTPTEADRDLNAIGTYRKLLLNVTGQRKISPQNSFTVTSACQFSSKNLDPMSEIDLSGPSAVRAYDVAAVSVDQGCFAQTEFVHQQTEQRAFFGFFDIASGKTNHSNHAVLKEGNEKNKFSIFGAGVGARLNIADKFNLSITYAKRLESCGGCAQSQAQDRLWAALTVTF